MDALAHLERDEVTTKFKDKDAGVILGIIPDKFHMGKQFKYKKSNHRDLI